MFRLLILTLVLVLSGCAATGELSPPTGAGQRPLVILIGIDGFRPDYLDRDVTPTLNGLRRAGAFAVMRPSFPSLTFPNHYTLVTGVHPDRHGIVNNTMLDARLGRFALHDRAAVEDQRWWDGAEPVWVSAHRAGLTTATMFWPGSETDVMGVRPDHWMTFDQGMPSMARVDQALAWLSLQGEDRPDFITIYFDVVDSTGHNHGPDAPETTQAVATVDAAVTRLVDGLSERGLSDAATIVVVGDHGMAATSPDRVVTLDDLIPADRIELVHAGAFAGLNPVAGHEAEVETALLRPHDHMACYRKGDLPARFAYGAHPRVPAILCLPDVGWVVMTRARPLTRAGGAHGYDNQSPEMATLFIAHGPAVRAGVTLDDVDAVDVQPLLARLLGIEAPAGDGRLDDLLPALEAH